MIKVFSCVAFAGVMTFLAVAPAAAEGGICLSTRNIKDTAPQKDGTAILFTMKDGSVWRNDLKGRCPDMKWDGFSYSTSNPLESICDNEQTLHLFRTGEVCSLGKFTQVSPPRMEQHAQR